MAFIIRNTTDRDVVLDDLRVILGPHKTIDLDRVAPRHMIDSSPKLRLAFQQKRVATVSQDGIGLSDGETAAVSDIKAMEQRLKADFRNQIATLQQRQPVQTSAASSADAAKIEQLTETIQKLVQQLATKQAHPVAHPEIVPNGATAASIGDGIRDDIATRIHAKTMQRLEKQVTGSGNVEHVSTKIQDTDLSKRIDELEGLL